jgi:predicted Zn-dependent protease with MMP-like domain
VNQANRGSAYGSSPTLPDKITIWQGTIERFAGNEGGVESLVRRVVWHEIAHHFGFDEPGVRALERKWEREGKL